MRAEGIEDRGRHIIRRREDLVVPESDYAVTQVLDVVGSFFVQRFSFIIAVGIAVDLDYEPRPEADEVSYVLSQRVLPSEFETGHAAPAQN